MGVKASLLPSEDDWADEPTGESADESHDEALRMYYEQRLFFRASFDELMFHLNPHPDAAHVPCLVMLLQMLFLAKRSWLVGDARSFAEWYYHGKEPWYDADVLRGSILALGDVPDVSRARRLARELATVGVPKSPEDLKWLQTTDVGRCIVRGIFKDGGIPFNKNVAAVRARMLAGDWFKDVLSPRAVQWGERAKLLRLTPATSKLNAAAMEAAAPDEHALATVVHAMKERPHWHDPALEGKTDRRTFNEVTANVASFLGGAKARQRPRSTSRGKQAVPSRHTRRSFRAT
jgi:hypothetical protein